MEIPEYLNNLYQFYCFYTCEDNLIQESVFLVIAGRDQKADISPKFVNRFMTNF